MSTAAPRSPRTRLRVSILGGVIALLAVLAVGAGIAITGQTVYTAESSAVVLPDANLPAGTSASYYETLSDGQIVATYAEVANNSGFERAAERAIGLTAAQSDLVTATVTVVPNTSVLLVTVKAGEADVAEKVANRVSASVVDYVTGLASPYRAESLADAAGTALRTSPSPLTVIGLAAGVAIVAGIVVQQLIYQLSTAYAARRRPVDQQTVDQQPVDEQTLDERPVDEVGYETADADVPARAGRQAPEQGDDAQLPAPGDQLWRSQQAQQEQQTWFEREEWRKQ